MEKLSIIVPCYNESECLADFYGEICKITAMMDNIHITLIFIDDGSTDRTLECIKDLSRRDARIQYISFSRNFGKEPAILAGLRQATGDLVAIMDADLQDPPELLEQMIHKLKERDLDCVAAQRITRTGEPFLRSVFAKLFYKFVNAVSDVKIVDGARDYRVMTRRMTDSLISLRENTRFSKGLFLWVGYKTEYIQYESIERKFGKTKWSFGKLILYSIEGIVSFSVTPLIWVSILGVFIFICSIIMIFYIIWQKIFIGINITGYAAMICITLFLGGAQLFSMGILGQYLARIFIETKNRPIYIIRESSEVNIDARKHV